MRDPTTPEEAVQIDSQRQPIDPQGRPGGGGAGPDQPTSVEILERRLSTRTMVGAVAAVLALAAAIVAIVLALDARDNSASSADLRRVERQLSSVAADAGGASEAQRGIDALSSRLDAVEDAVDGTASGDEELQGQLDVVENDIEDLRQQISELEPSGAGPNQDGG